MEHCHTHYLQVSIYKFEFWLTSKNWNGLFLLIIVVSIIFELALKLELDWPVRSRIRIKKATGWPNSGVYGIRIGIGIRFQFTSYIIGY